MKLIYKNLIFAIFLFFLMANVLVFLNSLKLADQINHYEKGFKSLHQENLSLQNQVYEVDSLQYAASLAAELNFSQKAQPEYLENLKYARGQ